MNETLQTIAKRYSCRAYDGRLPEHDQLDAIATAAIQSPSSRNTQAWQIVVVTNKALIEEMDVEGMRILAEQADQSDYQRFMERGGSLFYNAPCIFFILRQPGGERDSGIVCENIALAATSLGLGNCICGMAALPFDGPKGGSFKQKIGITEEWEFGIAILVGYALSKGTPHETNSAKIRYVK